VMVSAVLRPPQRPANTELGFGVTLRLPSVLTSIQIHSLLRALCASVVNPFLRNLWPVLLGRLFSFSGILDGINCDAP
jgi:hypothetical protein